MHSSGKKQDRVNKEKEIGCLMTTANCRNDRMEYIGHKTNYKDRKIHTYRLLSTHIDSCVDLLFIWEKVQSNNLQTGILQKLVIYRQESLIKAAPSQKIKKLSQKVLSCLT